MDLINWASKYMNAIKLTQKQINDAKKQFANDRSSPARLFEFLAKNPNAKTLEAAKKSGVINISLSAKWANVRLKSVGLLIACTKAEAPTKNEFGQLVRAHTWGVYSNEQK